jgi:hypothetical protein
VIRAYPRAPSVAPGAALCLHVATDRPRFRVAFYRWADGPQLMHRSGWLPGADAPERGPDVDWDWPAYAFAIPADWPSSVYIADLEEDGCKRSFDLARGWGAALFVVCAARPHVRTPAHAHGHAPERARRMLYKLPLATYHAYNYSGGGCFYFQPPRSHEPPGARLSLRRPGGGIGGPVWCAPDHYDASSPRQTFAHWDARFIGWLARRGYTADFCTDLDLHTDPGLLGDYGLLVSSGHDEYWSEATRDAVEAFVERGGNVAFFAANLCWWRIHLVDGGAAMVCHQGGPQGARDRWWTASGAARPEDRLCGVSYRHGGGWWDGPRETAGYIVQQAGHWLFAGTGLNDGDTFGRHTWPPLAGYECDGVPLERFDDGRAELSARAGASGTPASYELLAAAPLGPGWQELPAREHEPAGAGPHAASPHAAALGLFQRNGTVFAAGSTDWPQVLACARDRRVERITQNVLDRLLHA